MIEVLTCAECGAKYTGDPEEVALCLKCDPDPEGRNVNVFRIESLDDSREFRLFDTLHEAFQAASYYGLVERDFCVYEEDAITHHEVDAHYRNAVHEKAFRDNLLDLFSK